MPGPLDMLGPVFASFGSKTDSIWPSVIGAFGQLAGGYFNYLGQSQANSANRALTAQQMEFSREMRNTSYQAAVQDARKAGLNPALLYSQGGAATPAGSSATMVNPLAGLAQGVSNAASTVAQLDNIRAQTRLTNAQAENVETLTPQNERKIMAEIDKIGYDLTEMAPRIAGDNPSATFERKKEAERLANVYQDLMNQAASADMAEKKADEAFWKAIPEGKYGQLGTMILEALKNLKHLFK